MSETYSRLAPSGSVDADAASRIVHYIFSDESVGRDGHVVLDSAWQTANFAANPVFLWMHDDSQPPIGRVFDLHHRARQLRGAVKYAETPFAEMIYQLVRGDFLSATSVSWQPLAYNPRPGGRGVIFTEVDLLEISQVPVPALPTALATARGKINTQPLYEWAERALDTGRLAGVDRPLVEAVCRAARPASIDSGREARVRRARELQMGKAMLSSKDQQRYERYRRLAEHGYSLEEVARDLWITPEQMRTIVAHGHASVGAAPSGARKFSQADRSKLRGVERLLATAAESHASLAARHDRIGERVRAAQSAHRELTSTLKGLGEGRSARTTSTLAELGYDHHRVTRALSQLGDALGAIQEAHGDAEDVAQTAHGSVRRARAAVNGMITSGSDT